MASVPQALFPFYTIGHSTRPVAEFVALLLAADVRVVADVRTVPRSRANPQFNRDVLPQTLLESAIDYEHLGALGGLRGRSREVPPELNAFWENASFHNYADYALGEGFRDGLGRLRDLGRQRRCVIMCAEALWWRCHRRIISDYLLVRGETVIHILGVRENKPAELTSAARARPDGSIVYPSGGAQTELPLEQARSD